MREFGKCLSTAFWYKIIRSVVAGMPGESTVGRFRMCYAFVNTTFSTEKRRNYLNG